MTTNREKERGGEKKSGVFFFLNSWEKK